MSEHTTPPAPQNEYVSVRLVGGPACWAGKTLDGVYTRQDLAQPTEALGTMLTVPDGPDRPWRDEESGNINLRACYAPLEPDDFETWHFSGFFPPGRQDPSPAWYLREGLARTATAAEGVLNGRTSEAFTDAAAAKAWLDEHHGEIVKAISEAYRNDDPAQSLTLAQALDTRTLSGPHAEQLVEVAVLGLTAARALGDEHAVYDRLLVLSTAHRHRGEHEQAVACGREAAQVAAQMGPEHDARAAYHLGSALAWAGEHEEALSPALRAVELAENLGDANTLAASYDTLGEVHAARGEYESALASYQRALEVYTQMGYLLRADQVESRMRAAEQRA